MPRLNNDVLAEISLELRKRLDEFQRFVLAGKENFLLYLQIIRLDPKSIPTNYEITTTLPDGKQITEEHKWDYQEYMCGRYLRTLTIYPSILKDKPFIRGLKENKYLEQVRGSHLYQFKTDMNIFPFVGSLLMKRIIGDLSVFKGLDNTGCKLQLDALEILGPTDPTEVLVMKYYSVSEIELRFIRVSVFVDEVKRALRENNLNKIKEVISDIGKEWESVVDPHLHIDINFENDLSSELFSSLQDVKENIRNTLNCEIKDVPLRRNGEVIFSALKQTIFSEKFVLNFKIIISCSPPPPSENVYYDDRWN
ncbi:hypothetical protein FO519_007580 [Halicephalobus sp. NKZ332]|nr:hypothetical protein FO519_007580 [Halicephalobus sp. NKZ332]